MIIPCIDLMDGVVVQLVQGRVKALEAGDPLAMLEQFSGFPCIQVIDLDAATGRGSNEEIVQQLAGRARIRAGGGVRTIEKARRLLDCGVEKVVMGTAAFTAEDINLDFLQELISAVPKEAILIALDSKAGRVVVKGWRESLHITAEQVIRKLEPFCGGFLCTYVDKEGMMEGTDLDWFRKLRESTALELTAAGGISSYEEIQALAQLKIHSALGMAVYTGRLDLKRLAAM